MTAFSSPWGGRPPLRRGYAAGPPPRSSCAQRQFSLSLKLGDHRAASQSTPCCNLVICNTPQNRGLTREKHPPDTRHQQRTRPSATVQTQDTNSARALRRPSIHKTPTAHAPFADPLDTRHQYQTPDTKTRHQDQTPDTKTRHQTPDTKTRHQTLT